MIWRQAAAGAFALGGPQGNDSLRHFRQQLYSQLGRSKAALFDLMDAVLTTSSLPSFVHLSLSPLFRRRWSSVYKALMHLRLGANRLCAIHCQNSCAVVRLDYRYGHVR